MKNYSLMEFLRRKRQERGMGSRIMSTDFNVVDDESKTFFHLGQRMSTTYSFGFGSTDHEGAANAAEMITDRLKPGKSLRIVLTDDIPDGYSEEKIDGEEERPE